MAAVYRILPLVILVLLAGCAAGRAGPPAGGDGMAAFAIDAVNGPPEAVQAGLIAAVEAVAAEADFAISAGDDAADYRITGYLSTIAGTTGTVIVSVWDVTDAAGIRVHRISDQRPTTIAGADPWMALDDATRTAIAAELVAGLLEWSSAAMV